jgi:hypothetical protein
MKKPVLGGALLAMLGAASYVVVSAQMNQHGASHVRADLSGYQEDPAVSTTGHGLFTASIDDNAKLIFFELTYAALEGGATLAAHIHFGGRDHNGGVSAFLCGGGDKPPCPPVAGTITGVIDAADVIGPANQGIEPGSFDELVRAMRAGVTYVNVHTTRWPGGEIRGQIRDHEQREVR